MAERGREPRAARAGARARPRRAPASPRRRPRLDSAFRRGITSATPPRPAPTPPRPGGARARPRRPGAGPGLPPSPRPSYRRTFARLLGFLRPYRWSLALSVVLAAASQGSQIAIASITGHVIDRAIRPRDRHELWLLVSLIVALGLVKALLMVGRRFISGRQALGVEFDMRNALYSKLVRLSFGFYDRHQTGQLMSRATVDLQAVRFFLGYGLIFFFQHVLTLV